MTIRTRNRLNIGLFVISDIILLLDIVLLLFSIFSSYFSVNIVQTNNTDSFFFTKYNPYVVLFSLFFQIIYVSTTSLILFRSFEKTQASDIVYFYLFLIACLVDSFRLWIPLFNISESYSKLLFFCGNSTLFAKILIPLSLFCTTILGSAEQRQDIEKNIFILLLVSIFFAGFIPLNSAVTLPNFSVDHSFKITIRITSIIVISSSVFFLLFDNKNHLRTQHTTIGFALISSGIYILHYSTNLLKLLIAISFLTVGNFLYLKQLHNQYLWNN